MLTGIAVMLACAGTCTAPPDGAVFCARETGTIPLFTYGGNSGRPWVEPPTRMQIGLENASQRSVFTALARRGAVIRKATIMDNTGSGRRMELAGVRVRGASIEGYGPNRPLISLEVSSAVMRLGHPREP
jgi:hypothetical protein